MRKRIYYLTVFLFTSITTFWSCQNNTKSADIIKATDKYKGATLNILCWEGYADEKFTKGFQEKYGVTVKGTYFTSSDDLVAKLQNGGGAAYDIVTPSTDVASYLVQADLVQALDVTKISKYDELAPLLRNMTDVVKDGNNYGMPFTWGPNYLIYNADVIKEEPKSWNILGDPKYKNKISLQDDIASLYIAGQLAGIDKTDKAALYNMTDEQLATAKAKMLSWRSNVHQYWGLSGDLDKMFKNKEVVLAMGWPLTPATLNKEGMNIKACIPQEGATGWIDRLMIVKGAKNQVLAECYLDYISQGENMAKVAEVTNYSVASTTAGKSMSKELQDITYANNASYYFERLNFWQHTKNKKKYNEIWNEIKNTK
jgi:spermidine/putrescine-binding protein